jgi:hypothetical protein
MAMNTGKVQGVFAGMVLFMIGCIFLMVLTRMNELLILAIIFGACIAFTIGLKAMVLEDDRNINEKDVGDIALNATIAVLSIVGSTMALIMQRPLIGRAFENTVGYKWINWNEAINNVFVTTPGYDYSIIATQLFDDQMDVNKVASMFSGITVQPKPNTELLEQLVTKKHNISKATLISLATVVAFYISYLPVWKPWIR